MKNVRSLMQVLFFLIPAVLILTFVNPDNAGARYLPGDAAISASAGNQMAPFIVQGGNTMLVVWTDWRSNPYGTYEYETSGDIYGMRLDANGNPLDALPFEVAAGPSTQKNPRAAWNGTNWLVVFESYDLGGTGYYYQESLEAVRVSPAGQVLDAKPIKIYNDTPVGATWAVASDGSGWVVVNQGTSVTGDLVASRISTDGVLLDLGPKSLLPEKYYMRGGIHLAYAGGVFLLAYEESMTGSDPTNSLRFDSSLALLDAAPRNLATKPFNRLVSNGSQFYAVWVEQLPDYTVAVKGSRIGTSGLKLDGTGVVISGTNAPIAYTAISVAWDGTNWKVTWGAADGTRVARVNTSGTVLDPGGVRVAGPSTGLTASSGNGGVQLVWANYTNGNYDVFTANVSSGNVAGPNRTLSVGAPQQVKADVATSGSGFMLVYRSVTSAESRVMAQPLDAAGNPLSVAPVLLDTGPANSGPGSPNVAWSDGAGLYMVSWGKGSGIYAQRLSASGVKIDSAPFPVMSNAYGAADVAAIGDTFLVTARRPGYTPEYISAIAARVSGTSGSVIDPAALILGGIYVASSPAVTAVGNRFFVAFHSNATHDNSAAATLGAFVPLTGPSEPAFGFTIYSFSTGGGNGIFEVGLASDGNQALVVQSAEVTSGVENDLLARFVSSTGSVGPVINLTPWTGNQYRPRVAWDGANFIVVYQDQKNRLTDVPLEQLDARSDIFGMRITPAGTVLDTQGFLISASPIAETDPTIASTTAGVSLIAASYMNNDTTFANYRIEYDLFDASANEWPVAALTASPAGGDVPVAFAFSPLGSFDPDGSIAGYLWDFGDGATSTAFSAFHIYTVPGPYVVTLSVTDNGGSTTYQNTLARAVAPNKPPVAVASANVTSGNAPLDVIFSANGSYDPDGFIGNIEWQFSDGGRYYGSTAYHTFTTVGDHTATMTVYDSRGGVSTSILIIHVGGVNQPPVAKASATPTSGNAPLVVQFSSAGSFDPDGSIKAYSWNFGDAFGYSSSEANPSYTYGYAGTYTATLTVTDNNNVSRSASVTITVSPDPATSLRSTAISLSAKQTGKKVTAAGQVTVKDGRGAAVSGATVTAQWTRPGGSVVTQSATTNGTGVAQFQTSGGRGTYTLTVTDVYKYLYTFDAAGSVLTMSITK